MATQLTTLDPGTMFGSYRVERLIGAGGMGCVYEATHLGLEKRVALKTIHLALAADDAEAHTRFLREGRAAARVKHPHIVDVTDVGVEQHTPYLVMELLEGESLTQRIAAGPMSPAAVVDTLLPILDAMQAAHDASVIHRDLKPDNVFLARTRRGEEPKIVDFGISKVLTTDLAASALTGTGKILGTPCYMSPEQTKASKDVDHRSDIYALGVIAYEMLTGERAFKQESLFEMMVAIVEGECAAPRDVVSTIPEPMEAIVRCAMNPSAEARYQSAHEMGRALLPFASGRVSALWSPTFGTISVDSVEATASTLVPEAPSELSGAATVEATSTPTGMESTMTEAPAPPSSFGRLIGIGTIAAALSVAAGGAYFVSGTGSVEETSAATPAGGSVDPEPEALEAQTFEVDVEVVPSSAELVLDGETISGGQIQRELALDASSHTIVARADGYLTQTLSFTNTAPPSPITLELAPVAQAPSVVVPPDSEAPTEEPAGETSSTRHRRARRRRTPVPQPTVRPFNPPVDTGETGETGANNSRIFD